MKSDKPDHFVLHPEELKDGAKLVVARLVQDRVQSIRVPQIYDTVEDAIKSGKGIVIRSDHPAEYNGLEGVLTSLFCERINEGLTFILFGKAGDNHHTISSSDNLGYLTDKILHNNGALDRFIELRGLDVERFLQDFNFTFWEKISGGINGAMWADPVIKGKYHFAVVYERGDSVFEGYYSFDTKNGSDSKGRSIRSRERDIPGGIGSITRLIAAYEEIRSLGEFNHDHCYDMEFQIDRHGDIYFLQLRRLRDFSPQSFVLRRELERGEIATDGVIGSTTEEGEVYLTRNTYWLGGIESDTEAFASQIPPMFPRTRFPNLKAALLNHHSFAHAIIGGHASRELVGTSNLVTNVPRALYNVEDFPDRPIRYLSDGERCLIKPM